MKVTAQYAEDHLADVLNAADKGEEAKRYLLRAFGSRVPTIGSMHTLHRITA
jgi:hypothetical protein